MCYCEGPEAQILNDLKQGTVPDDALLRNCCWRRICQVRGKRFNEINDGIWNDVCDRHVRLTVPPQPSGF